jgi:hypothetical protein
VTYEDNGDGDYVKSGDLRASAVKGAAGAAAAGAGGSGWEVQVELERATAGASRQQAQQQGRPRVYAPRFPKVREMLPRSRPFVAMTGSKLLLFSVNQSRGCSSVSLSSEMAMTCHSLSRCDSHAVQRAPGGWLGCASDAVKSNGWSTAYILFQPLSPLSPLSFRSRRRGGTW